MIVSLDKFRLISIYFRSFGGKTDIWLIKFMLNKSKITQGNCETLIKRFKRSQFEHVIVPPKKDASEYSFEMKHWQSSTERKYICGLHLSSNKRTKTKSYIHDEDDEYIKEMKKGPNVSYRNKRRERILCATTLNVECLDKILLQKDQFGSKTHFFLRNPSKNHHLIAVAKMWRQKICCKHICLVCLLYTTHKQTPNS